MLSPHKTIMWNHFYFIGTQSLALSDVFSQTLRHSVREAKRD